MLQKKVKKRASLLLIILLISLISIFFILQSLNKNILYFKSPSDIKINQDISCKFENGNFYAKGKLGEMNLSVDPLYTVEIQNDDIFVKPINDKDKLNPKQMIEDIR